MNGWVSACMSAPVYTATTPGWRRAASTSMPRMSRVGERAAHEVRVEHPGHRDVVDVAAVSR